MRKVHVAVLTLATAMLGTACHRTLDVDKLAKSITETIDTQLAPSKVTHVDCPGHHALEQDDDFSCKVTLASGATMTALVHQKNGDGDIAWHVSHYDIDAPHLEAVLAERAAKPGSKPSFHCPDGAHFDLPGSWLCDVTAAGQTSHVKFTMQQDGSVTAAAP